MEIKRKQLKQAVLLRQANHQALKQLLLAKKARLRSPQVQLHLKRLRHLRINLSATATPSQAATAPEQRQGQEVSNQQAASQQAPAQTPSTQQAPQAQSNQSSYDPATDRKLQDKQAEQNKRYKVFNHGRR